MADGSTSKGFAVTFKKLFEASRHRRLLEGRKAKEGAPDEKRSQARTSPRPPRAQSLRGRHGEVHRLRALRRRVPCQVHLCARCRQRPGRTRPRPASVSATSTRSTTSVASTAICASRPARPRRSPSRSCSSSRSRTAATRSTPRTSCVVDDDGQAQATAMGRLARGRRRLTSGWMRATSPAGDHRYEGVVHWAGELGYGVRAPEPAQRARSLADGLSDRSTFCVWSRAS